MSLKCVFSEGPADLKILGRLVVLQVPGERIGLSSFSQMAFELREVTEEALNVNKY